MANEVEKKMKISKEDVIKIFSDSKQKNFELVKLSDKKDRYFTDLIKDEKLSIPEMAKKVGSIVNRIRVDFTTDDADISDAKNFIIDDKFSQEFLGKRLAAGKAKFKAYYTKKFRRIVDGIEQNDEDEIELKDNKEIEDRIKKLKKAGYWEWFGKNKRTALLKPIEEGFENVNVEIVNFYGLYYVEIEEISVDKSFNKKLDLIDRSFKMLNGYSSSWKLDPRMWVSIADQDLKKF